MKNLSKVKTICFFIMFIFSLPVFSQVVNDSEILQENVPQEKVEQWEILQDEFLQEEIKQSKNSRKIGANVGIRLSVLGLSPTASFITNRFELEVGCSLSFYGFLWKNYRVGFMPQISLGYISPFFETGWKHGVGIGYAYLSDALVESIGGLITAAWYGGIPNSYDSDSEIIGLHSFFIYYKSGWQFKRFGIYFRFAMPVFIFPSNIDFRSDFSGASFLDYIKIIPTYMTVSFITQSIGIMWRF